MEQFLARFTLSFLMAQLFPGAVAILSITCPIKARLLPASSSMSELFMTVGNYWFHSFRSTVIFLFLSGAMGLLIHGVGWTTMAWLENHDPHDNKKSIRTSFWHKLHLGIQIFIMPPKMLIELLWVLCAPNLDLLRMEENAASIRAEDKPAFDYLQDFYLYFAEFYVHTSYALLLSFLFLLCTWLIMGFTFSRLLLLALIYLGTSIFFLIGRIQFLTLFKAEHGLIAKGKKRIRNRLQKRRA